MSHTNTFLEATASCIDCWEKHQMHVDDYAIICRTCYYNLVEAANKAEDDAHKVEEAQERLLEKEGELRAVKAGQQKAYEFYMESNSKVNRALTAKMAEVNALEEKLQDKEHELTLVNLEVQKRKVTSEAHKSALISLEVKEDQLLNAGVKIGDLQFDVEAEKTRTWFAYGEIAALNSDLARSEAIQEEQRAELAALRWQLENQDEINKKLRSEVAALKRKATWEEAEKEPAPKKRRLEAEEELSPIPRNRKTDLPTLGYSSPLSLSGSWLSKATRSKEELQVREEAERQLREEEEELEHYARMLADMPPIKKKLARQLSYEEEDAYIVVD